MLYDCFIFGQNQLLANFFREFKSDSPISRFLFPKLCFTVLGRSFEFSFCKLSLYSFRIFRFVLLFSYQGSLVRFRFVRCLLSDRQL